MMTTTTTITPIPHLAPGQSVKDWRRRFIAATATLKDGERKAMLPAYVHRTSGEVLIAEVCSEKATLEVALVELENLIDGVKSKMVRVNEFWTLKPDSTSYTDIMSFFFTLRYEGKLAGVSFEMIMIKFLNALTNGEKLYNTHKDKIKSDMTEVVLLAVFEDLKTKILKASKESHINVKKEQSEEMGIFVADQENLPTWASELKSQVHHLKGVLEDVTFHHGNVHQEETQIMLNSSGSSSSNMYNPSSSSAKRKCYVCGKPGHLAYTCNEKKCGICGKSGHVESQCYSKSKRRPNSFPASNNL